MNKVNNNNFIETIRWATCTQDGRQECAPKTFPFAPQFVPYPLFKIVLLYIGGLKWSTFTIKTLMITPSIWGSIKNIRIAPIKVAHCKKIELWDTLEQYGLQIGMSLRVYNMYTYMPQNIYMTPCKFNKLGHVCACLHLHVEQ